MLLGDRCIEHDEAELAHVLDWYTRRGEQSKLIYEDELGRQIAEKIIPCTGPLEDLQYKEIRIGTIERKIDRSHNIPDSPVPDDQNIGRRGRCENHQSGSGHARVQNGGIVVTQVSRLCVARNSAIQRWGVRRPIIHVTKVNLENAEKQSEPRSMNRKVPELTGISTR